MLLLQLFLVCWAVPGTPDLDSHIEDALKRWNVPGCAVVVVRENKILHLKGYGVRTIGQPERITPETLFPLASCTKAFTTTLIATLVDGKHLHWDDRVRKHYPPFRIAEENADQLVTMRDLLCHRTGIGGHDLLWYRAPWSQAETLRRIPKLAPSGPFRGSYQYSSLMVTVAGLAAANRLEQSWETLLEEKLLQPLGITRFATTTPTARKLPNRATGHQLKAGKVQVMPDYIMKEPDPAGSLHLAAQDLAPWMILQLNQGKLDGKQIVSAENLNETHQPHTPMRLEGPTMLTTYPESTQVSYGLGWVITDYRGKPMIAHGGMIDGFRIQITLFPKQKLGIALLNNLHETRMNQALTNTLADHLLKLPTERNWNDYYLQVEADEAKTKQEQNRLRAERRNAEIPAEVPLKKLVGKYAHPAYGTGEIKLIQGTLTWTWSSFSAPLEHWSGNTFRVTSGFFEDEIVPFEIEREAVLGLTVRGIPYLRQP